MATNPYFKDYSGEQDVTEDLTIEIIKAMGREMYYIPRNIIETDKIFGEGKEVNYKNTVAIEMYIDSVSGFQGQGDIASKFGIEIKDNVFLTLSKKRFMQEVQTRFPTITRPREGDLIYFPLSKSVFEINFVEHENPFYSLGKLYSYRLTCELFTYDQETVSTGTTDIDAVQTENRQYTTIFTIGNDLNGITVHGYYAGETVYQVYGLSGANATEQNATGTGVVAFKTNYNDYVIQLINTTGNIVASNTLKGKDSGIESLVQSVGTKTNTVVLTNSEDKTPAGDNDEIETEATKLDLFNFTDTDPFSEGNY
jgi:Virus neck protein